MTNTSVKMELTTFQNCDFKNTPETVFQKLVRVMFFLICNHKIVTSLVLSVAWSVQAVFVEVAAARSGQVWVAAASGMKQMEVTPK